MPKTVEGTHSGLVPELLEITDADLDMVHGGGGFLSLLRFVRAELTSIACESGIFPVSICEGSIKF